MSWYHYIESGIGLCEAVFKKKHILISCFPKSASSFVSGNIAKVADYEFYSLTGRPRDRRIALVSEQNLNILKLARKIGSNTVSQAHCPGNSDNVYLINRFNIRNIVLTRNIFDSVVSLRDHILNDNDKMQHISVVGGNYYNLPCEDQLNYIIYNVVPWYVKFYVSWSFVENSALSDLLWVTYEDMVADQEMFFRQILDYCDIPYNEVSLARISSENQPEGRLNVGVTGRGDILSDAQRDFVRNLTSYYPEVDFSRMGIS